MAQTVLVADDEPQLVKTVRMYLEEAGYHVVTAANGREALFVVRDVHPDIVILDVMMPEVDGFTAARRIREESRVPIIMLTARDDEFDQALGLELGADDYIVKPFSPRILVARVRAALRRAGDELAVPEAKVLRVGNLVLNEETRVVTEGDNSLDLTRSEFDILATFMNRPGRVFTRMELLEHIHGEAFAAYERTIDVHIKNLRAKLKEDRIETIYGVGYRFHE
ncbi:MAG: response regulator transcription factor [Anaerolineae bacterium]|nr:response regulator transcription factor [Anaerolineae bacterium]